MNYKIFRDENNNLKITNGIGTIIITPELLDTLTKEILGTYLHDLIMETHRNEYENIFLDNSENNVK